MKNTRMMVIATAMAVSLIASMQLTTHAAPQYKVVYKLNQFGFQSQYSTKYMINGTQKYHKALQSNR